ncbi:MAG: S4 domain-containing protein, partial [Intrasporangium sp.]|uniref:S4 domain-containing protein n=1 Tax=Intrasporangium sp. TaxID=1925024 RepID=UPI003F7EE1F4
MTEHSRSPRKPRGQGRPQPGRGQRPRTQGGGQRGTGKGPRFAGSTKAGQPTRLPERPRTPDVDVHDPEGVRLQKLLASAGVGSRRVCENLITEGRVEVDGQVVTELGGRIDPKRQAVHVDGERVNLD